MYEPHLSQPQDLPNSSSSALARKNNNLDGLVENFQKINKVISDGLPGCANREAVVVVKELVRKFICFSMSKGDY